MNLNMSHYILEAFKKDQMITITKFLTETKIINIL